MAKRGQYAELYGFRRRLITLSFSPPLRRSPHKGNFGYPRASLMNLSRRWSVQAAELGLLFG